MDLLEKVTTEEGFRSRLYKCPAGKLTIGYGFNLEAVAMPKEVADLWISILLNDIRSELSSSLGKQFDALDQARQAVLIDMAYQMGVDGLLKFNRMLKSLFAGDYERASKDLLDSAYARQTPNRAYRNSESIKTGVLQ